MLCKRMRIQVSEIPREPCRTSRVHVCVYGCDCVFVCVCVCVRVCVYVCVCVGVLA